MLRGTLSCALCRSVFSMHSLPTLTKAMTPGLGNSSAHTIEDSPYLATICRKEVATLRPGPQVWLSLDMLSRHNLNVSNRGAQARRAQMSLVVRAPTIIKRGWRIRRASHDQDIVVRKIICKRILFHKYDSEQFPSQFARSHECFALLG